MDRTGHVGCIVTTKAVDDGLFIGCLTRVEVDVEFRKGTENVRELAFVVAGVWVYAGKEGAGGANFTGDGFNLETVLVHRV